MQLKTVRAVSFNYLINILRRLRRNNFFFFQVAFKEDHIKRLRYVDPTVLDFMTKNIFISSFDMIEPEFKKFGIYVLLNDVKTFNPQFLNICRTKLNLNYKIVHTKENNIFGAPADRYICIPDTQVWIDYPLIEYFSIISFDDKEDLTVVDEVNPRFN